MRLFEGHHQKLSVMQKMRSITSLDIILEKKLWAAK